MTQLLIQNITLYFAIVGLAWLARSMILAKKEVDSMIIAIGIILMLILVVLTTLAGHNIE